MARFSLFIVLAIGQSHLGFYHLPPLLSHLRTWMPNTDVVTTAWSLAKTEKRGCKSACAQWCAANFAPAPGADCTDLAAQGTGPCYVCGPRRSDPHEKLCGGACSDTSSDSNNCGACGNVVSSKRMPCVFTTLCSPKAHIVHHRFDLLIKRLCLRRLWRASLQRTMPGFDFRRQ